MTLKWGILLENGHVMSIGRWRSRDEAKSAKDRWNAARRQAIAEQSIVIHRHAIGLVRFKAGANSDAAARIGSIGGKARAAKLSPRRRKEIAKKAAAARWQRDSGRLPQGHDREDGHGAKQAKAARVDGHRP